jgi:hypothetical protein
MAVIVTTTITARCWKQHTCSACGCVYRYLFTRKKAASGTPHDNTRGQAELKIARAIRNDIDECPCPTCGLVQPDMVGKYKKTWHLVFTVVTGVILGLIVLSANNGGLPLDQAGKVAAAVAGFAVLGHLMTALGNPNARPARNRKDVQQQLAAGKVEVVRPGTTPNFAAVPPNLSVVQAACLLAIFVAPAAFLAVVWVSDRHPMPRNQALKPDVIGPGDIVTIPMKTSIQSIGGYWRGSPTVKVLNAAETGTPSKLVATSDPAGWGKIITVKSSSDPFDPIKPWVKVSIPEDASLGGKVLRLQVALAVSFPVETRKGGNHIEKSSVVQQQVEIHLAEAGLDRLYKDTWNKGIIVGLGGCLLGGLGLTFLNQRLKSLAKPHQVFAL